MEDDRVDNVEEEDSQEEEMDQEQAATAMASQQPAKKKGRAARKRQLMIKMPVLNSPASAVGKIAKKISSQLNV